MAPCGARGGPGAAQARLPSHAVALHPPPVHPCVRPLREVPCRHGAERRRRPSEARAWGAQPPALSGSDVAPAAQPDCRSAALMRALCAGFFRRPRRGRREARTRPRVVRCGGREAHPRKARPQMSAAAGSPRKALCSVSAPLQPAPPHSSAGGRTRRAWRRGLEHAAGGARTRRGSRGVHLACSSAALRLGLCPLRVLLPADEGPCLSRSSPAASFSFSSPFFNFRTCSERTSQKDWCLYPDY